jgi:hypothetical protein
MSKIMGRVLTKNTLIGYSVLSNVYMVIPNMEEQEWGWQFAIK